MLAVKEKEGLSTRGIVHAAAGMDKFNLFRFEPGQALKPFVEHYWAIRYDLSDSAPYTQKVLSYPNVHLAFEQDENGRRALLYGIPSRPFTRELSGAGLVLGVKFRAGGFYPYGQREVAALTGTTIEASQVFGPEINAFTDLVLDAADDAAMAEAAESFLLSRLPERDMQAELAGDIVQDIMAHRSIIGVEQLSERCGLTVRQLQRLFRKYIGVTPKWVIKRFRLQEVAEQLERNHAVSLIGLASELGYYDQAHFIKDFKSVLGESPMAYRNKVK